MPKYTKTMARPHKTRIEKCTGHLAEPRENYGKWAYWWGPDKGGWHSMPEPKETDVKKDSK